MALRTVIYDAPNPSDRIIMEVWEGTKLLQAESGFKSFKSAHEAAQEFIDEYPEAE